MADACSLADARAAAHALGAAAPVRTEVVGLDGALGRIAGEDVVSDLALPGFDSSAMDGWAVRAADVAGATEGAPVALRVDGESRAGRPAAEEVRPGTAFRISTGARIPAGADAVVRVEDVGRTADAVLVRGPVTPGRDVRRTGEDVAHGDVAVPAGALLGPGHVALLAGLGRTAVVCRRRPRALVVVTGDEVRGAGGAPATRDAGADATARGGGAAAGVLAAAGRVHDVGGPALTALLRALGADVVAVRHAADDLDATVAALRPDGADLVISTGGVSVGPHDHVRAAAAALDGRTAVAALDLQPGRPTWLGTLADDGERRPLLALPGNPGAAITVAALLLPGLLRGMTGRPSAPVLRARLAAPERPGRRVRALRVALLDDEEGRRTAHVLEGQQAHRLASLPGTDAYALILRGDRPLPAGAPVEVVPVPGRGPWSADIATAGSL